MEECLKVSRKNLSENYNQKITSVRKGQLKNKEDVPVTEAFELYMLKKFFNLELNAVSSKMLSFWEKDFSSSIDKHLDFLNKNLEDQDNYGLKFSEILQNMDIFNSNNDENKIMMKKITNKRINQKKMMIINQTVKKKKINRMKLRQV